MEEHEEALGLLARKLKDHKGAKNYCATYSEVCPPPLKLLVTAQVVEIVKLGGGGSCLLEYTLGRLFFYNSNQA